MTFVFWIGFVIPQLLNKNFRVHSAGVGAAACVTLILYFVNLSCAEEFSTEQIEFFEKIVRPLLSEHCYQCHSVDSEKIQAGLLVDSRAGLLNGGDSGKSIVPGDPDGSLLMEAVRWESYEMPPNGKLSEKDIGMLAEWIRIGAPWPEEDAPQSREDSPTFDLHKRAREHWCWQPIQNPPVPEVKRTDWPKSDLDRFVLARLEAANLQPASDAAPLATVRRLYLDLIGLPPTPEQIADFQSKPTSVAIETLVDQLLDSPHFGERWGRHWLDLVRYAESRGHEFDDDAVNAYQYRDYVIRAFNADVPYDQLIREHIAGDLINEPRLHLQHGYNESVVGTGFWFLGEWVHSPVDILKDESDRFDNMIDVMSKTFLGVTVSCARCHDHKFDAISTADYYSLTGFLHSSDFRQVRFESIEPNRKVSNRLAEVDFEFCKQIQKLLAHYHLVPPSDRVLTKSANERVVFDYGGHSQIEFIQDGFIFGAGPRQAGSPWLDTSKVEPCIQFAARGGAINDPIWDGLESIMQKDIHNRSKLTKLPRSGRTLRTPTFECTGKVVACEVDGVGHVVACVDSHRHVAGPLHGETVVAVKANQGLVEMNLGRYVGHRIHLEFTPAKGKQLQVFRVLQGTEKQINEVANSSNADNDSAWGKFSDRVDKKIGRKLKTIAADWADARNELRTRMVKRSHTAMAMLDGTGEDAHVYVRGNSSKPGRIEPRHFLTAITGGEQTRIKSGSGRLDLAREINDPSNPLTARVIVNRIWHHLMGRGIVPTTDDFGVLGQRPTHPQLLDYLATKFYVDGQSIKKMIRYIVLSRMYQMSSRFDSEAIKADPKNMLWHYRPPKRLEGEAIRDSLLAVSGNLDAKQFGQSVPIHLTSFMNGRGRPPKSGPLDGEGRRSVYIAVRRNFLSPFMLAFDTPVPFSTMGRRNRSNVPAQALTLMNDPFVVQQASDWAKRALQRDVDPADRIQWMYLTSFAREPTKSELKVALSYLGADADEERWSDFAHALINTKEFIFLR